VTVVVLLGSRELRGLGSFWAWVLGCLLLFGFAGVTYGTASQRGVDPVNSGWFVLGGAVVAVLVLTAALGLRGRGHHRVARWLAGSALSLAAYAAIAGLTTVSASAWVVAWEGAWWIIPITLSGICCLVAAEELLDAPGSLSWGRIVPAALAAVGLVLGFGVISYADVYPGVPAPLGHTILGHPAAAAAFGVVNIVWMLSATIAPALIFRAAAHSAGLRRGRLTIAAVAATTPLLTLATCVLLWAGFAAGLLDDRFATTVLTVAFFLPPALVAAGVAVACAARDDGVTGSIGRAARWVLRGLWITVTAQLAALLAALLAVGSGTPSALAASTVAVVLCVVFVAAYGPVASRIDRFMIAEPAEIAEQQTEAIEPPLSGMLSPREREVLSLIAAGRSNAAIAAELFVSERTVDSHVSSIFDKLGLGREAGTNRRVQAAAAWIRADLDQRRQVS